MQVKYLMVYWKQPHSDPKPAVTDPNPETDVVIDTQGKEVEFTDNGNEQPTPDC